MIHGFSVCLVQATRNIYVAITKQPFCFGSPIPLFDLASTQTQAATSPVQLLAHDLHATGVGYPKAKELAVFDLIVVVGVQTTEQGLQTLTGGEGHDLEHSQGPQHEQIQY